MKRTLIIILALLFACNAHLDTITRGKTGKEDIQVFDGLTGTFVRPTSTSGMATLHNFDYGGVDILQAYGDGTTCSDATIRNAVSQVGSTDVRFILGRCDWVLTSSLTTGTNITLDFSDGATIDGTAGGGPETLTVNGGIKGGDFQIFRSNLVVIGLKLAYGEWFGALGDGSTDDRAAFQLAVNSLNTGSLIANGKTYIIGDSGSTVIYRATTAKIGVDIGSNITIIGQGQNTVFKADDSSDAIPLVSNADSNITLRDFRVDGNAANQSSALAFGIYLYNSDDIDIGGVWVENVYDNGIELISCTDVTIGKVYTYSTAASSIGGGLQLEDCQVVTVESVTGSTYDDLVSVIAHDENVTRISFGMINGKSEAARAFFIGQSSSAAAQRTISDITAHVNSYDSGVTGKSPAFSIYRGAIFRNINVTQVDRSSYRAARITPYDATYHGQLKDCRFDITSYDSSLVAIEVQHDNHADTDYENNTLIAVVKNPNASDSATNKDGILIAAGDWWNIDLNIYYPSGKENVGFGAVLGGSNTNDTVRYSNVRGSINGGAVNLRLNNAVYNNLDGLVLWGTEKANEISLDPLTD